uniref:Regulator of chromosome condensation (RCC1) and BTB (POZ) domain containing protein 1 n=1 Tax=Mus musculus TaxID=10090 RepID=G3UYZ5_MOUSE
MSSSPLKMESSMPGAIMDTANWEMGPPTKALLLSKSVLIS